jgi:hypothetical protein
MQQREYAKNLILDKSLIFTYLREVVFKTTHMAINPISSQEESGTGLEFIADWLENKSPKEKQIIEGQAFTVKSISVSQSGKGYTCITPAFMAFFWKKSEEGQMIKEWLESSEGYQPVVVIDCSRRSKCLLAEDDEVTVFFEQAAKGSNRYKIYDDPNSNYTGRQQKISEVVEEILTPVPLSPSTKPKK